MPIYEYRCDVCGVTHEHICKHSERPEFIVCKTNTCSAGYAYHVPSGTSFHLKGNCWARDGYTRGFTPDEIVGRIRDE